MAMAMRKIFMTILKAMSLSRVMTKKITQNNKKTSKSTLQPNRTSKPIVKTRKKIWSSIEKITLTRIHLILETEMLSEARQHNFRIQFPGLQRREASLKPTARKQRVVHQIWTMETQINTTRLKSKKLSKKNQMKLKKTALWEMNQ